MRFISSIGSNIKTNCNKNFALLIVFILVFIWKLEIRETLFFYLNLHWVFSMSLSLIFMLIVKELFLFLYFDKTAKDKNWALSPEIFTFHLTFDLKIFKSNIFKENVLKMSKELWNATWSFNSFVAFIRTKINFVSHFCQSLIRITVNFSSWVFIQRYIKSSINISSVIFLY